MSAMEEMAVALAMSKHEGAGNDFLIMLDLEDRVALTEDEVRRLADRHRGIGADGVITVTEGSGGSEVTMSLRNQDGSFAEISGNGLRCVAHEVVRAGIVAPGAFSVMTGAGLRRVSCVEPDGIRAWTEASMGTVSLVAIDREARSATISVGNPHLVLVRESLDGLDVEAEGAALQERFSGGVNVEWIAPVGDGLVLAVYERGVGVTLACGSGSVAAALAARELGLSGDDVTVQNPGGPLQVHLDGFDATLSGEVTVIADLLVPLERVW
jgi:diaminopimelate epimerase